MTPADLAMFERIGVSAYLAAEVALVRRVSHSEARELCGIRYKSNHLEGLAFPYIQAGSDQVQTWRVRRDHPEVESDGTPIAKYVSPPDRRHFYLLHDCYWMFADTSVPAIFVEAEKSVLAIVAAETRTGRSRSLVVGLGGCWGWRGVTGKTVSPAGARVDVKGPIADFDLVNWKDRAAILMFDANVATNTKVQAARKALAEELTRRGAKVLIAEVPLEDGVNGPDDYIGRHGDAAFFALLDAAKPPEAKKAKSKSEKTKQGREVLLEDPEPWPDPVDGDKLLAAVNAVVTKYVALPKHGAETVALWVLHTYLMDVLAISAMLAITSPTKRCGKTLLLIVMGALVPRRLFASNVTPAVLFRAIEKYRPTLLIDEADTFLADNEELRGILNSGHTRGTANVLRAVGDEHEPRIFSTWAAKAVAKIGVLPGTLADRSIEVRMRRRSAGENVSRLRQDKIDAECAELRRQAARWAADNAETIKVADPDVPAILHDRAADCWRPLLAIADAAGGAWPAKARAAAVEAAGSQNEDDRSIELLTDIYGILEETDDDPVATKTIIEGLLSLEDRPWKEWRKGKPYNAHNLARTLKGFGIMAGGQMRTGADRVRGYRRAAFKDAFDRYLPPEVRQRDKPNNDGVCLTSQSETEVGACLTSPSETNHDETERCLAVSLREGGEKSFGDLSTSQGGPSKGESVVNQPHLYDDDEVADGVF